MMAGYFSFKACFDSLRGFLKGPPLTNKMLDITNKFRGVLKHGVVSWVLCGARHGALEHISALEHTAHKEGLVVSVWGSHVYMPGSLYLHCVPV